MNLCEWQAAVMPGPFGLSGDDRGKQTLRSPCWYQRFDWGYEEAKINLNMLKCLLEQHLEPITLENYV